MSSSLETAIDPDVSPWELELPWHLRSDAPESVVAVLVGHAVSIAASDMYFVVNEDDMEVQVRHLGIVRSLAVLSREAGQRCIAHIRAMGQVRLNERRHPQDGRWVFRLDNGRVVDLRINTVPTLYGECLAMRLFERDSNLCNLESLGLVGPQMGALVSVLQSPSGLILVTGPTGCGKTTTLYACLQYLHDGTRKIHTLEDPIEFAVRGLHQTQVDIGFTADFQEMLRGILRQGPDVLLIGEVRDQATAETTVRAANSGQLVFASLHAPVAAAALQSMLSLGIPGYLLGESLLAVVAQRLVRTVDRETAVPMDLSCAPRTFEEVQAWLDQPVTTVYAANGGRDGNRGYVGRTGVFEILTATPEIRRLIAQGKSTSAIARQAVAEGMIDFRRAGLLKVATGLTTFDELQRALPAVDGEEGAPSAA
jgi:type II secretory ATPase GspE/PulE/Tfp pilus assembly ATPase PilB-like protein